MKKVDTSGSSSISWARYDEKKKILHIGFAGNDTAYRYKEVSLKEYRELEKAASKGEYINHHIKPNHEFEKDERQ